MRQLAPLRCFVSAVLALSVAGSVAWAGIPGSDLFVISSGRGEGANDSFWYTSGWIHSQGEDTAAVTISLLRRDQANLAPEEQFLVITPGATLKVGDILFDLFGAEAASGALRFQCDSNIVVSTRVFNLPGTDLAESQGQFIAGLPSSFAIGLGQATDIPGITQPVDGSFRCNFAMVETAGLNADVRVTLLNGLGVELAARTYALRPYEPKQKNLSDLGSGVTVDGGRLHVEVISGSGRVLTLASMVGNGTMSQDPSTLEMELDMAAASGDGDITAVFAGEGLTGGGSEGDVTVAIDTAGAIAGQAMVFDGTAVGWDTLPGGLTLPYSDSHPASGAAFKVSNTSVSGNVFGIRGENASTLGSGVMGWSSASFGVTSGVTGQSSSSDGVGVFGLTESSSGETYGVIGMAASSQGAGVAAYGWEDGADLVVGGNADTDTGDDGRIFSDQRYPSSDLQIIANGEVEVQLDRDDNEEQERFAITSSDGSVLFEVDDEGDVRQALGGAGLAKAGARVICGTTSYLNAGWYNVGAWPEARPGGGPGECIIDFGFEFWVSRVMAMAIYDDYGPYHVNCKRFGSMEDDEIFCAVFNNDGSPADRHSIALIVF